jgi:cysteine synthase
MLTWESAPARGALERFREAGVALPTFRQLAWPHSLPDKILRALAQVDPDEPHPLNLFRVHWFNGPDRRSLDRVPGHFVVPPEFSGVPSPIVVALGYRFPMIRAHKVLAAYGCLAPRIVSGQFDPARQRALWPSTGNYCRGGVAISRIMGCRGVAILPEGMSAERFEWLSRWVAEPGDIVRTPGSESNVKEIYDACKELARDPDNVVFNQFSEFGNYLVHFHCTGRAMACLYEHLRARHEGLQLAAFVAATGSAGTLGAGDFLKEDYGSRIVAAEASECPTMLRNGYGEHNIQGIGDKHIPLIHNVMNTDLVVGISDRSTDQLSVLFGTEEGRRWLIERRRLAPGLVNSLATLGLSGICNVLAAIKAARHYDLGPEDALFTVATDHGDMYASERQKILRRDFPQGLDPCEIFSRHLLGLTTDDVLELTRQERTRIFNLGYYTWVEQQGVPLEDFEARRRQSFWRGLHAQVEKWDQAIIEFNRQTGVLERL